jgi:hypothetical protein
MVDGCQNRMMALYGPLNGSQAVSEIGVSSDNRIAKPIPGNFPNDFGKI